MIVTSSMPPQRSVRGDESFNLSLQLHSAAINRVGSLPATPAVAVFRGEPDRTHSSAELRLWSLERQTEDVC